MIMEMPLMKGADTSILRSMLDASAESIFALSEQGEIIECNATAESMFVTLRSNLIDRHFADLFIPPDRIKIRRVFARDRSLVTSPFADGEPLRAVGLRVKADNFPAEIYFKFDSTRVQRDCIVIVRDLTLNFDTRDADSRRLLQTRLIHQAHMLAAAAESTEEAFKHYVYVLCEITNWPIGHIYVRDRQSNLLISKGIWHISDGPEMDVFRQQSDATQFERGEDLPGRVWERGEAIWLQDVATDPKFSRRRAAALKCGIVSGYAIPIFFEGELFAVAEFFMQSAQSLDASLLGVVDAVGRQLSRAIEAKITQTQRDRLAAIVDVSADAVIALSQFGIILSWNKGAELLYGHSEKEAVGSHISLILPGNAQEIELEIRSAIQQGQKVIQFETVRRHKDGRLLIVALSASPLKDSQGRIIGSAQIERDITDLRRREEDLKIARKTAEAANRAKDEFLANISHELRTPLNAILGMVELSLAGKLDATIRDYLATVKDSSHILLGLLNDLLDLSRMEVGKFEVEQQPFRMREMIQSTMKSLSVRAFEKGLEFVSSIESNVPDHCLADGRRIRQILVNLLGNAIKFTESGEVVLRVQLARSENDQAIVRFVVRDTGIGISFKERELIFEPFTQVDSSTTRRYQGSGLGLAISKGILEQMGGRIWVESEVGKGTTFYVETRIQVLPDGELLNRQRHEATIDALRGESALVVDDNETNRHILLEVLTSWGMSVKAARDGQEALQILRERSGKGSFFRLVLIDALMPEMDGFTLVERMHDESLLKGTTLLMLSSTDRQTFRAKLNGAKVNKYLEKPIAQSDLLQAIVSAIPHSEPQVLDVLSQRVEVPLKILVAEDMPANLKVVKGVLERRGHVVTAVANGAEAVRLAGQEKFDVILMDVQMPNTDGLDATRQIRALANPQLANVPILAMTAHAMRRDREKCLNAGMNDYISKPIDANNLCMMVERFTPGQIQNQAQNLQQSQPAQAAPSNKPPLALDVKGALNRLDQDHDLLMELMVCVFDDCEPLMLKMEEAKRQGQIAELARMAHNMKGLACNVGGKQVMAAAARVEDLARENDGKGAKAAVDPLRQAVTTLRAAIKEYQASLKANASKDAVAR